MSELKMGPGKTNEWYTPPEIFEGLNVKFDLDPCSSGDRKDFVPAKKVFTKKDNGFEKEWKGFVFMNPPFGGRNGVVPWLEKFIKHGNGIAIARAYTSAGWFHDHIPNVDAILFPRGKTQFIRADGTVGKGPSSGIVLIACGKRAMKILKNSGLGIYFEVKKNG